ncbi:MAG: hypothetical protein N7Q72_01805 [Spiroplasma sp. Tabriz.8]|nr:hypothetical protein [Spiroplasma sp. Tabriz.8]
MFKFLFIIIIIIIIIIILEIWSFFLDKNFQNYSNLSKHTSTENKHT